MKANPAWTFVRAITQRLVWIIAFTGVGFALGCSPKNDSLFAEACDSGNSNCQHALIAFNTSGALTNVAPTLMNSEDTSSPVVIKSTKYGDKVTVDFVISNKRLVPLRSFSLTPTPGDPNYVLETDFPESCSKITLLFYGQACTLRVSFTPGTAPPDQNVRIGFLTLTGTDYFVNSSLTGAVVLPDFFIVETSLDFPQLLVYNPSSVNSYERDLTITNYGSSDIHDMQIGLGTSNDFSLLAGGGGYCAVGQTLASFGSCLLKVRFKPLSEGLKTASLNLTGSAGASHSYTLSGSAVQIAADKNNLSFAVVLISTAPTSLNIHLDNPTDSVNTQGESCIYALTGSNRFSISANTCAAQIAAGFSCDVTVLLTPDATVASHSGFLNIVCDERGGQLSIPISAQLTNSPLVSDQTSVDFRNVLVGTSVNRTVTLSNTGASSLTNFQRQLTNGAGPIVISSQTCGTTIAAGASCTVNLTFAPSASGPAVSTLSATAAEASLGYDILLEGTGQGLRVSTATTDFGSLIPGQYTNGGDIVVTNPSTTQTVSGCAFDSGAAQAQGYSFASGSTCTSLTSLTPGQSCVLKPKFSSAMPYGIKAATLSYSCAVGGAATMALTGQTVQSQTLTALPPSLVNFSGRLVGITATQIFTYYNADAALTAGTLSFATPGIALPWSRLNVGGADCSGFASLVPGQSCEVKLQYQPLAIFGSEQTGSTSGVVTASADNATPADRAYVGTALKIAPQQTTVAFGTLSNGVPSTSGLLVITNPSLVDDASSCTLTASSPFTFTNQSCGATLLKGGACHFQITLPSQAVSAVLSGTARMDCGVGGRAAINLSATVVKPATLQWSGTAAFGSVDFGSFAEQTLTLTHIGAALDAPTTNLAIEWAAGASATYAITTNNCTSQLSPGGTCTVVVRFTPSSVAAFGATLNASDPADTVVDSIALTGSGLDPSLRLVPSVNNLSINGHLVGASLTSDFNVTNNAAAGNATGVTIGNPSSGAPWTLGVSPSPCGATLNVGSTCTVRVAYAPAATGTTSGSIGLSATNMTPSKTVTYSGTALAISSSATTLAFGIVDYGAAPTLATVVTVTNPSTLDNATGCTLTAQAPFTIVNSTCGATLNTSSTCSFQMALPAQFADATLNKSAAMACTVGGTTTVAVTATILDIPDLSWNAAPSRAFGQQDTDSGALNRTYTLQNIGISAVQLTALGFATSSSGFTITGGTCTAATLLAASGSAGDTCTVAVRFDPVSDTTGSGGEMAAIRASTSSPVAAAYDLTVVGTGTTLALTVDLNSLTFSNREVGQAGSESQTVVLTNTGTRTANLTYSALTNPPFTRGGTCAASLAAVSTCTLILSASAAVASATHSATLTATDTLNGVTKTATVALAGATLSAPALQGVDDRGNTTYAATIASSDITGPTDNANNIVDLSPVNRSVTYTLKNNIAGAATLTSVALQLNYKSGINGTMALTSDTCTGQNLAANATCTFQVTYTPTANLQVSVFTISATATSAISGTTSTFTVTDVVGHAVRAAQLTLTTPIDIGPTSAASTGQSATYSLSNTGDQTATSLAYAFLTGDTTVFARDIGVAGACGTSLAGGANCNIRITLNPGGVAGVFTSSFDVTGTQAGANISSVVRAASYNELTMGNDGDGIEGDLVSDSARYYLVSRVTPDWVTNKPMLNLCSKTAKGAVNSATCVRNDIGALLGGAANSNLAGDLAGSGPRVQQSGNKIILTVQNKDAGLGGEVTGGTATVIICQKPGAGSNTIAGGTCAKFVVDSNAQSGQFPSLAVTSTKVILTNTNVNHQLTLAACTYTDSTGSTDNTTLDLASCKYSTVTAAQQGWYTAVAFNGSQAIVATYDESVAAFALRFSACSVAADNTISNCNSTVVDNTLLVDGGSNLYPGTYPSLILSGSTIYAVHQLGKLVKMRLQLSSCTVDGSNVFSGCFNQTVVSGQATGATPRLAISGTSASGRLWITGMTMSNINDNASNGEIGVYKCDLPLSAASCSSISSYFLQPASLGTGPIYSRSVFFDATFKILIAPFEANNGTTINSRNGILNLGLFPEM